METPPAAFPGQAGLIWNEIQSLLTEFKSSPDPHIRSGLALLIEQRLDEFDRALGAPRFR